MSNEGNLKPVKTKEEARERGKKGGIASGEARRAKKTMRETVKTLMSMQVIGENNKRNLANFGIDEKDQNYQTALVVRLMQKALVDGDTASMRLIGELTGDLNKFGISFENETDVVDIQYPSINLPDNGRDRRDLFQLSPQAGPQTMFMSSPADIVVYGGAAGGGKTYALLLEILRNKDVKDFGAVIFRKNFNQITAEGGLWDASNKIFRQVPGAIARKSPKLSWQFTTGAKLSFAHIERDENLYSWQGTEIAYIGFDELTHFTRRQFLYMLSRNRSTCGIRPYMRATCNPDADSWVADFISWWIDPDTGYPIPQRSGQMRWMCVINDVIYWGDTVDELVEKYNVTPEDCKSVTFIASKLEDNKILMEKDPGYISNLKAMTEVDMERLLKGNWKIKASAGRYFKRIQVKLIEQAPDDIIMWCRAWDLAATSEDENGNADFTSGVLMGRRKDGTIVVLDVINQRIKAGDVEKLVYNTSVIDRSKYGYQYIVRVPQDPGQAGKVLAGQYIKLLSGFNIKTLTVSGSKETRATPFAAQWQNGNVEVLLGEWNDVFFSQLESFPESKHDDIVDASSDAFSELTSNTFDIDSLL